MVQFFFVALIATSGMTLFSYAWSIFKKKNYVEPLLLNEFFIRLHWINRKSHVSGWIVHYMIGVLFCVGYEWFWSLTRSSPSFITWFLQAVQLSPTVYTECKCGIATQIIPNLVARYRGMNYTLNCIYSFIYGSIFVHEVVLV